MDIYNKDFWIALDNLVKQSKIVIDRPRGTAHPKYPDFIYKVDYGYLENTSSMDGGGIDVWVGTKEEKEIIYETHNESKYIKGILIER